MHVEGRPLDHLDEDHLPSERDHVPSAACIYYAHIGGDDAFSINSDSTIAYPGPAQEEEIEEEEEDADKRLPPRTEVKKEKGVVVYEVLTQEDPPSPPRAFFRGAKADVDRDDVLRLTAQEKSLLSPASAGTKRTKPPVASKLCSLSFVSPSSSSSSSASFTAPEACLEPSSMFRRRVEPPRFPGAVEHDREISRERKRTSPHNEHDGKAPDFIPKADMQALRNAFLSRGIDFEVLRKVEDHANDLTRNPTLAYPKAFSWISHAPCKGCGSKVSSRYILNRRKGDGEFKTHDEVNVYEGGSLRYLGCTRCSRKVVPLDAPGKLIWNTATRSFELERIWPGYDHHYLAYIGEMLRKQEQVKRAAKDDEWVPERAAKKGKLE
jgi:hypothetical protein